MDPYADVSLQPLPEYTVPSDGVTMTCITCTDRGHIFLAGRDGHVYELHYTTGSGWHKRCRKVCLTAGLGSVISRYVLLFIVFESLWSYVLENIHTNIRYIKGSSTSNKLVLHSFLMDLNDKIPYQSITQP